ncbi:hypothetical protein [Sorangium sp. So ce362]|uniref:hypothetical protein n=1 Tax=Sorangium sp. So ce362 TaxID=3133303 RepID=UPI003F601D9E
MQRWPPVTCEQLRQAPVVPGVGPRPDSLTPAEDEELLELTGRRGFPILAGVAFGYPAARALAPSSAPSERRDDHRLFAWDRWTGARYLDSYGHLGSGQWREHVTLMAHVSSFDAFWPRLVVGSRLSTSIEFWGRLNGEFSLSPSSEEAWFRCSVDVVLADARRFERAPPVIEGPRLFARTLPVLADVLRLCDHERGRAAFDVGHGVAARAHSEISIPAGAPLYTDPSPLLSRRVWVADDRVIQCEFALGQVVSRLDVTRTEAILHRSPLPPLGSPRLERYLEAQQARCVAAPPVSGPPVYLDPARELLNGRCIVMPWEDAQPDAVRWLGLLPREVLPLRLQWRLDKLYPGFETVTTGLHLVDWPLWSWRRWGFVAVGAWHDWMLLLWSGELGLWSYARKVDTMSFVAGEIRTWLEIRAAEDALAEAKQLDLELAFPLDVPVRRGLIAERLGLRPVRECTDHLVSSFEGEGLWIREMAPPIGAPFCVARCDTSERALALVERAREAMGLDVVAIGSLGRRLSEALQRAGFQTIASHGQWWSDFNPPPTWDP